MTKKIQFSTAKLNQPRNYTIRVTDEMKKIQLGQSLVIACEKTAKAFYAWMKRNRMKPVKTAEKGGWRVGRTG